MDTPNQKVLFVEIRNFLVGRVLGATMDRTLLEEVMKCMFAKKQMLLSGDNTYSFDEISVAKKYRKHFKEVAKLFKGNEEMLLDPGSIAFVDSRLGRIDLLSPDRDPVGDLYETFVGSSIRGADGQFFTPQNAGRWLVEAVGPSSGDLVIDPACGAGGFLLWAGQKAGSGVRLCGIEKDAYLASLARARIGILGMEATVYCGNSLSFEEESGRDIEGDLIGQCDVVLTNPPFGKNITSVSVGDQALFQLGHRWRKEPSGKYVITGELATRVSPQVLFIERIMSLLKTGGRAGLVVPESLLSNRSYSHVVQYIQDRAKIIAVVGMPEALFKHSGKGGTHTKTCLLAFEKGKKQQRIFMGEAKWCGHDSRGRTIPNDDLPGLINEFKRFKGGKQPAKGYLVEGSAVVASILAPRYYEPTAQLTTEHLKKSHELISIQELIDEGVLEVRTGNEIGKLSYGTGDIPFVRTSDISSWEIKIDPKHYVSEEVYEKLRASQDVKSGDVLMVRDGTYLIGSCAIVTDYDEKIVYQSHLLKFRCLNAERLSPYLLLALLASEPVQKQIKSKTFTLDIIDSLGSRIYEIILPIPRSKTARNRVDAMVKKVIEDRVEARELARKAKAMVVDSGLG